MNTSLDLSTYSVRLRAGLNFWASAASALLIGCASAAHAADGDLDTSFGAVGDTRGANAMVTAATVKPDGKILIGGQFSSYDNISRPSVAQLNADGSLDTSFDPGTGINPAFGTTIDVIAVQDDGKILIGGAFTNYNGAESTALVRVNANGSLDTTFNGGNSGFSAAHVHAILVQPDGKILVAGNFSAYNGIARRLIIRLNVDGSLDSSLNLSGLDHENDLFAIGLQSDGRIIIGGAFYWASGGLLRFNLARLNSDGSLDRSFDSGGGPEGVVRTLALQQDGKVVIGGNFREYYSDYRNFIGVARPGIARVNTDGTVDNTFDPGTGFETSSEVVRLALRPDRKVVVAGSFTEYNGAVRRSIVRINADGSVDPTFTSETDTSAGSNYRALALQPDGKVVIGGAFDRYKGIPRNNVARLLSTLPPPPKPGPPLPATTGFTVNDSSSGFAVPKDSVLRLRVSQPSTAPRLAVRVQSSTTPDNEASWTDLNNGSFGRMIFDVTNNTYVLNTTTYPRVANVHFRAISSAPAHSSSTSNVVGPFDLTSSTQHLGRTILSTTRNGIGAKINFRAFDETHPSGISMRIQSSTSPGSEASWTDLPDGNGGKMAPYRNPGDFFLDSKNYPANGAVYFRAVASAPGYVDSPSRGVGPFNLTNSPAPVVTVTAPARPGDSLGGDFQFPVLLPAGAFTIEANAQPNGGPAIKSLGLLFDGQTIERFAASSGSRSYAAGAVGDHVVEAFAIDDLNVTGDSEPIYVRIEPANGKICNRVADGAWNDPTRWLEGVPGPNDLAIIGDHNVTIPAGEEITVLAVAMHGGSIRGDGSLIITGTFTVSKGSISLPNLTIASGGMLLLVNEEDIAFGGTINNEGTTNLIGRAGITGIRNGTSAKYASTGDPTVGKEGFFDGIIAGLKNIGNLILGRRTGGKREARPAPQPVPEVPRTVLLNIQTAGIISSDGASIISSDGASIINDQGSGLIGQDGAGIVSSDGASIISSDGASIISSDGASIISSDGASIISGGGGNIISGGGGNFTTRAASTSESVEAASAADAFVQTGGATNLTGIRITGPVILNGGVLQGRGVIDGDLTNDGGFIAPGNSAGSIGVTGNFTQTANGSLLLEVGGINSYIPEFDQLKIGGSATLDGKLSVKTINGFTPDPGMRFVPLSYESATGTFASTSGNVQLDFTDSGAALTIAGANPPSPKLLNIATRLRVERGQDALIGGFIITGSAPKRVIIRALGPSLEARGIAGGLADPTLELFRPDGSEFNNNWRDSQEGAIIATTIAPSDNREAAIVATLEPGVAYTAVVRGVDDTTGVGLVEVYDLDAAAPSTLANISTRGLVQTGENVMIGGLIIGGDQPAKVLIRAIGPSLGAAGVEGALQDPTLELYTAQGAVITNDDWRATQEGEIIATTVPPGDSREAAILATLPPGNYTAIVRGKNDTRGVALVEAYNLQ